MGVPPGVLHKGCIVKNAPTPPWVGASEASDFRIALACIAQLGRKMTSIQRVRCDWTGFIGQPGVSTFYAVAASTLVPQLRAFFDAIKLLLPTDVNIQVEGSGDELESTTGALTGSWTTTTP